jgi:hypothetical protein
MPQARPQFDFKRRAVRFVPASVSQAKSNQNRHPGRA